MNVLITGHSRGLGEALADIYLGRGDGVFGVSRTPLQREHGSLTQVSADLCATATIDAALKLLFTTRDGPDLVFLNAGILGPIAALNDTDVATLQRIMDVNVWANKLILDWLVQRPRRPQQIIAISSGASVSGNFGWGPYAMSKASLNMLIRLYAHELPDTHLTALAPGLIDTDMQSQIRTVSAVEFPSLQRLHDAQGSESMPPAQVAAEQICQCLEALKTLPSGDFIDLRKQFPIP